MQCAITDAHSGATQPQPQSGFN